MIGTVQPTPTDTEAVSRDLEARFRHNVRLFEAVGGDDFTFGSHEPTSFALAMADEGYVTLVDVSAGGVRVYPDEPRAWARAQVAAYRGSPTALRVESRAIPILDEGRSAHIRNSNRAMRLLGGTPKEMPRELPPFVDLMLMMGCGLGYQIEALLEHTAIRHLCIVEPEPDIFYASLHTIDWLPILQHFSAPNRSLELLVGEEPEACYDRFDTWLTGIGGFNVAQPFVYQHLVGPKTVASYDPFIQRVMPERTSLLGYFDDERVGLAHTLLNVAAGVPVLRGDPAPAQHGRPAFIAANGPSLDDSLECIRANRDRVVLVSCGTALGSLMKAGLRPDVHVEMERDSEMREWIRAATSPQDREAMVMWGLNTVHPDVYGLFSARGMAMKPNDVGATFVAERMEGREAPGLDACNPTVANCAVALAARLGFEQLFLFGVDFGFPSGAKHHSELSIHYDVRDEDQEALGISRPDDAANLTGVGNLGGEVETTALYLNAGRFMERVLAEHPHLDCVNVGPGLRIAGSRPLPPEDVRVENGPFDGRAVARSLLDSAFSAEGLPLIDREEARSAFSGVAQTLDALESFAHTPVESATDGLDVLTEMHRLVMDRLSDPAQAHVGGLLKGSVALFSLLLAEALHHTGDERRNVDLYRACRDCFVDFCRSAREQAVSDALTPDQRRRELKAILA